MEGNITHPWRRKPKGSPKTEHWSTHLCGPHLLQPSQHHHFDPWAVLASSPLSIELKELLTLEYLRQPVPHTLDLSPPSAAGVPFLMTAELFTQSHRPAAYIVGGSLNWLCNFTVGFIFPFLQVQVWRGHGRRKGWTHLTASLGQGTKLGFNPRDVHASHLAQCWPELAQGDVTGRGH